MRFIRKILLIGELGVSVTVVINGSCKADGG